MEKILITGTRSGLGKHVIESFGGTSWNRQTSTREKEEIKKDGRGVIIHCAFNSRQSVNSDNLYNYLADNVLLTEELTTIPHQKFVFVSSVDVYPKQPKLHSEDEVIDVNEVNGIYGITKLMSESLVKSHCPNHLILRCVSLLGKHSKKNSLIRILEEEGCTLTLTSNSRFNYVLHRDVSAFIQLAINKDIQGLYNLASLDYVTLQEVATMLGRQVNFGIYHYDVGDIDNSKILFASSIFNRTSKDVIINFISDKGIEE